ncbi:MAG: histidine kinase [Bacteroidetes bacterium]|nr:histidine kinase [Bacteroidota bacterium]
MHAIGYDNILISLKNDSSINMQNLSANGEHVTSLEIKFSAWSLIFDGAGILSHYSGRIVELGVQADHFLMADSNGNTYEKVYFDRFGGNKDEVIYICYKDDDSLTIITNRAVYRLGNNIWNCRRISWKDILPETVQVSFYRVDNFMNEWYPTNGNGIWCRYNLHSFLKPSNVLQCLYNTKCIGSLNNGCTYWVNKKGDILYELKKTGSITTIKIPEKNLPLKIDEKSDSEFYLCANNASYVYNEKSKKYININAYFSIDTIRRYDHLSDEPGFPTTTWKYNSFKSMRGLVNIRKNKWIMFDSKATVRTIELQGHTAIMNGLDVARITKTCYDSADHIYIFSGQDALSIYNAGLDRYFPCNLQLLNSLGIHSIRDVACDNVSNVYLLDNDKIGMYNIRNRKIKYLECNLNLSDVLISVYKDYFFIAGKFGLAYAKILGPLHVGKFHVAVNMNSYNRAYDLIINKQGVIYISTDKGVIDVNADEITNEKLADPGNFFMLNINTPIHRRIISNDTVNLSQDIDKITLNVVNLVGKGNIEYNYVIEDYGNLQETTTGEIVTGTLKAGHYYKVKCSIQDDAWVSKEFVFYIYRVPYWWQKTNWVIVFWISGILAFGTVIFIVMLLTRRVAAKANDKKRALTELELRAIYAQINPHFIFNTLSATLYFINKRKFDDAYLHINKFSRLIRGYLKSSQERYITLADEIEMLKNYIELQKTRFEDKLEYKIEIDNKIPVNNIQIPSLLLQPLVENAINHGLFHRKEGGLLLLQFLQGESSEELVCIIDDNGVGRNKAKEIKESSTVQYDSYGTKLTKQLIDVFKEFEKMGIELEYIDKQLPETGTIVKLTIKNIKYVA